MDPCELRLAKGDDAVRELIENPVPLFEFALRRITGTRFGHGFRRRSHIVRALWRLE